MANEFAELERQLQALKGEVIRKAQRKALTQVGELVKAEMVARAPDKDVTGSKGGVLPAGELKASIKARVRVPNDEQVAQGRVARVTIGPTGENEKLIAWDVENGHGNARGDGNTPAHPFVRPTRDAVEARATALYTESITADIQKAMSK